MSKRFKIRILPRPDNNTSKWYYGDSCAPYNPDRDLTGKIIMVKDEPHPLFEDCYRYSDSLFVSKSNCEIVK